MVKVEAIMFHDFMNQFKDMQRKMVSNYEKKDVESSQLINTRLHDLEKELIGKIDYTQTVLLVSIMMKLRTQCGN